jgi:arylsulfatase A-like enzyme
MRDHALTFLDQAAEKKQPFFLFVSFITPHAPSTPANQDKDLYPTLPAKSPNFNEDDVSDKPGYLRGTPRLTADEIVAIDEKRRAQFQSLMSIDRTVDSVLDRLATHGMLEDTVVFFLTDNGYMNGAHRLEGKRFAYEESIRTDFAVRWGRVAPEGRTESRFAANIDIAPTIYEAAGLETPADVDGLSLVPLLRNEPPPSWRTDLFFEAVHRPGDPTVDWKAVRNDRYIYIDNEGDTNELYDLVEDPFQLENKIDDPAYDAIEAMLTARLSTY